MLGRMNQHVLAKISDDFRSTGRVQPMVNARMTPAPILIIIHQLHRDRLPVLSRSDLRVSLEDERRVSGHEVALDHVSRTSPHKSLIGGKLAYRRIRKPILGGPRIKFWKVTDGFAHRNAGLEVVPMRWKGRYELAQSCPDSDYEESSPELRNAMIDRV